MEINKKAIPVAVLEAYGLGSGIQAVLIPSGLINHTWKINAGEQQYILQRINDAVFREPMAIAQNTACIADHLRQHAPGYLFVAPLPAINGATVLANENGYYRLFPFVRDSQTIPVVTTAGEAQEAAMQFGRFTKLLDGFDIAQLKTTLPHFHDLGFRYSEFEDALENGNRQRIQDAAELIDFIQLHYHVVVTFEAIKQNVNFKLRVTHHDTKISNVLFDETGKGICVIDLDTVMPGYFISDVGDMMRTYLSPVSEEKNTAAIMVRDDMYRAIVKGYEAEMGAQLSDAEKEYFFYAGVFMIYMQALRFLTDHLNNDKYYGASYEGHNLVRAQNQAVLLKRLMEKEQILNLPPTQ